MAKGTTAEDLLAEVAGSSAGGTTAEDLLAEVSGAGTTPYGPLREGFQAAPRPGVPHLPETTPEDFNPIPERDRAGLRMAASRYGARYEPTPEAEESNTVGAWNFLNGYGLGFPNRIQRALDPEGADARAQAEERHPADAASAKAVGGLASGVMGPARLVAAPIAAGVGMIPGLASSAGGRIVAAGLTGAGAGAAQAGITEGSLDAAKTGGLSGLAFGAGAQALGEGIGAAADYVGKSRTAQDYNAARASGRLDRIKQEAATGKLPKGLEGQRAAANTARDEVLGEMSNAQNAASSKYAVADAARAKDPADIAAIQSSISNAAAKNRFPSSGEVKDQSFEDELADLLGRLGSKPNTDDVVAMRRMLQERANFANPAPGADERRARSLYEALKEGSRSPADDEYASFARQQERWNDLLTGGEDGARPIRIEGPTPVREMYRSPDMTRISDKLGRYRDENVPGFRAAQDLEELASDPRFAPAMRDLAERKAYLNTRYGSSGKPAGFSKSIAWPLKLLEDNAMSVGTRNLPELRFLQKTANGAADYAGTAGGVSPFLLQLLGRQ